MLAKRIIVYLFITVFLFLSYLFLLNRDKHNLIPLADNIDISTYHEGLPDNYSYARAKERNEQIHFEYRLTQEKEEPFTAVFFYNSDSNQKFIDFSKYDAVFLNFSTNKGKRIPITFTVNFEGFTSYDKELSNLPYTYLLDVNTKGEYRINLSDFEIPSWWLRLHQLKKEDFSSVDFSRVNYFVIGSCQLIAPGIDDEIIIKNVCFYSTNRTLKFVFAILFFVELLCIVILELGFRRKKILIPTVNLAVDQKKSEEDELSLLVTYIAHNYAKENLSQEEVEKETGIKSRKIGELLKVELGTNFKNYLNTIRISEVKRLLKETELSISEIAYKTGYGNVSHFNRVFKNYVKCSPKQFRENEN